MLVLSRLDDESIMVGEEVQIIIVDIQSYFGNYQVLGHEDNEMMCPYEVVQE